MRQILNPDNTKQVTFSDFDFLRIKLTHLDVPPESDVAEVKFFSTLLEIVFYISWHNISTATQPVSQLSFL